MGMFAGFKSPFAITIASMSARSRMSHRDGGAGRWARQRLSWFARYWKAADGSLGRVLLKLARIDVLVLDDFAMSPLKDSERRDFLEICDDRYQRRSIILTSQMPVAHWHEQIGDPTVADSILDRLVHNSYRIELSGESMRKKRGRKPDEEPQ